MIWRDNLLFCLLTRFYRTEFDDKNELGVLAAGITQHEDVMAQ